MATTATAATLGAGPRGDGQGGPVAPLLRTELPVGKAWEAELPQQTHGPVDVIKCAHLVHRVLNSIHYHLSKRIMADFVSPTEAELFSNLKDGQNGREVLTKSMRVLGNFTLAEGIMAGSVWTIDDQNTYISCMQNIDARLEEHTRNEYGDILLQGDMAVTSSLCHYNEQSAKVANISFPLGTRDCVGMTGCQFDHPDQAVHFCNLEPECTLIMHKNDPSGCEGGLGCYIPKKGAPHAASDTWKHEGGRSYVKHCPGALLQMEEATQQRLGDSGNRWQNGIVPYCFSPEVTDVAQEAFHIAVERTKKQVPCLDFERVELVNDTRCARVPSIIVTSKETGCWSYLGQISDKGQVWHDKSQPLNLDRGCELVGIAMHQLGHALGMGHENARSDRTKVMSRTSATVALGKEKEFGMSKDTVQYAWAAYGSCELRAGTTRVSMTFSDCKKLGGTSDEMQEDGDNPSSDSTVGECQLDLCEDGKYFPAPPNRCKEKVASIAIKMQIKDCRRAQGQIPNASAASSHWEWTDCHFDLCTDMGLHLAKPFACGNKLAYGYVETSGEDCAKMEGSYSIEHKEAKWANCYVDFCSGSFDAPFDFLSLMMYSPYAWSKTGKERTLEPLGNHSALLAGIMGQRMGFSGQDVFHLGHMYDCWDKIKPDIDSKEVSRKMITGEFFEHSGHCEDVHPDRTGFDVHGESGFMKHASCNDLKGNCNDKNATVRALVRKSCPISCLQCMPSGTIGRKEEEANSSDVSGGHKCFDAKHTGIRFRDGPRASCTDLIRYCKHSSIGTEVRKACKLSCGLCDAHIVAPFFDASHHCKDYEVNKEPQFTIGGNLTDCTKLSDFCQGHTDSYLVRHKCALTCGLCGGDATPSKAPESNEIHIPGDVGGCNRRRRFGACSSRRRRNV